MNLKPMKRVEIVISSSHLDRVLERLHKAGVSGYTVLPDVEGYGDRGEQSADDLSGITTNAYVLTAVPADLVQPITTAVQPLLESFGGICLITDCQWLEH